MRVTTLRERWQRLAGFWRACIGLACVLVVLALAQGRGADWFRWEADTRFNPALLEGFSWHFGRLSLPHRLWDTAFVPETDTVHNVFPPLQSIVGYVATGLLYGGSRAPDFPEMGLVSLVVFGLPLPIVGYAVFRRRTGSDFWAAVLTLGWLGGTAVMPCLEEARTGGVHHINHLLSQVGLLLLAGELLRQRGRPRWWLGLIGLLIAAWSRQLTVLYGVALLAAAWRHEQCGRGEQFELGEQCELGDAAASAELAQAQDDRTRLSESQTLNQPRGLASAANHAGGIDRGSAPRRRILVIAGLMAILTVPMVLNWAKFGSPFQTGYALIYAGRETPLADDARAHGLFSTAFLARNAHYMNTALPWSRSEADNAIVWNPSPHGTSLWLTTPLLALALIGITGWWRETNARRLMLCTLPIIAALLLYHNTGYRQYGYYRFAMDFMPVWLVVGARSLSRGKLRWGTLLCTAWGVGYFAVLSRWSGP